MEKIQKNLLKLAKILGQPLCVRLEVNKNNIQIMGLDKMENEWDQDTEAQIDINKKIKIDDPLRYI